MTGVFWLLLANAGVILGSRRLLSRFGTGVPATDAALFLLFRLLLISAVVLAAGALHLLRPWALGVAGGIAALLLIARGVHREFLPLWKPTPSPAIVLLVAAGIRLMLHAWFVSPFLADVTSYHLPKVAEWVVHGTIFTDVGPDARAWFPAGFELVETWWVVFLHHDVLIEMAGIEFLALGVASTVSLASRLGLTSAGSLLAGAIYATAPGMMVLSVFAINDAAVAAIVVATAALILDRVHPALILSAVALGTGLKPTYAFALPGLGVLWAWRRNGAPEAPSRIGRAIWAVAALALIVGAVWYVRNAVRFGNPFYPVGTAAFDYGNVKQLEHPGPQWSKLRSNLSDFVDTRILDQRKAVNGMLEHVAGWGVVPVAFGLIGLLAACRASGKWRFVAGAFVLSFVSVLTLSENDPWVLRFVLFFPALLSIAAAALVSEIRGLLLPLVALCGMTIGGTVYTDDLPRAALEKAAQRGWRERSFAPELMPQVRYRRVACYGDLASMSYLLYGPDLSREVVYLRPTSPADLLDSMERLKLPALYAMTLRERSGWGELLRECVRAGRLKHIDGPWYEFLPRP
jgi:hypothetical protein